jgi:uncharacterized protein YjiS (DUF1127 family)
MMTKSNLFRSNVSPTADAALLAAKNLIEMMRQWRRRATSRRDLANLSERDLWDLRLTRADAERESNKPFWRE